MTINVVGEQNSVFNRFVAEIRDKEIQKDSMRFKRNLERVAEIMAYEVSKTFDFKEEKVETPLGTSVISLSTDDVVIASILRAGLPMHQGVQNYFDGAENAFISAYRKYKEKNGFEIHIEYISSPDINGKTLLLVDPMLATGSSMELAYKAMLTKGTPAKVHIMSLIASQAGVDYIKENMNDDNVTMWLGAIDEELNDKSYIVPGLGDAGDLAFGSKI